MQTIHLWWTWILGSVMSVLVVHVLAQRSTANTKCDLSFWLGNQTIAWCSAGPPNITIRAVNYTGGCNPLESEGSGGIRLWVNVEKGHVQEMVGLTTNNCSLENPMFFLAEPFLKLGHCGVVTMFVMLYPIASMRANCTTVEL